MTFKDKTENNYNSFIKAQDLIKNNSMINSLLSNVELNIFQEAIYKGIKKKFNTEILFNNNSIIDNILKYKRYKECALVFSSGILSNNTGKHNTQEDSVLRSTNLYPILEKSTVYKGFYLPNKNSGFLKANNTIYIKNALVFKNEELVLMPDNWVNADFVFSAPPDLSINDSDKKQLESIIYKRLKLVFDIAAKNKITVLILGAYGCGSANNSPTMVAKIFKELINEYDGYFKKIIFSIKCKDFSDINYHTFYRIITNS